LAALDEACWPSRATGPGWIYEETYDGWRMIVYKDGRTVRLISRQNVDHTAVPRAGLRNRRAESAECSPLGVWHFGVARPCAAMAGTSIR